MEQHPLIDHTIAILVDHGFEQVELTEPKQALEQAGAAVHIISPQHPTVRGWQHTEWGDTLAVDVPLREANPAHYDALVLPGGVMNPDNLRVNEEALRFVRSFFHASKPVAAICHAPWTLIDAGVIAGRTLTSYASVRSDVQHAGATWVDREVVVDGMLVTSRKPDDLPAFNQAIREVFAHGSHGQSNKVPSSAPNAAWSSGGEEVVSGFDSPTGEQSTMVLTNTDVHNKETPGPVYPPGSSFNKNQKQNR